MERMEREVSLQTTTEIITVKQVTQIRNGWSSVISQNNEIQIVQRYIEMLRSSSN